MGLDTCNQWLAAAARRKTTEAIPATAGSSGSAAAIASRIVCDEDQPSGSPSAAATSARICQSSLASAGGRIAFDAPCSRPWLFV
jgi:hypothetical protein